jgi:hypothetical protein
MLDLDHPQTKHVFAASRIEEKIRAHLLAMKKSTDQVEKHGHAQEILSVLVPELHSLNREHFAASVAIERTLRELEVAVRSNDFNASWNCFLALAERSGDNFGTWAI